MVIVWIYEARDGLSRTTLRFYQGILWNWGLNADNSPMWQDANYFLAIRPQNLCHWNLIPSNITKYSLQTAGKKINDSKNGKMIDQESRMVMGKGGNVYAYAEWHSTAGMHNYWEWWLFLDILKKSFSLGTWEQCLPPKSRTFWRVE